MHLNVVLFDVACFAGQIDGKVGLIDMVIFFQLTQRNAAQPDVVVVVGGEIACIAQGAFVVCNRVAELGFVFPEGPVLPRPERDIIEAGKKRASAEEPEASEDEPTPPEAGADSASMRN